MSGIRNGKKRESKITRTMATKKSLNCALINIQSVTSKTLEIRELIAEKSLDILALTETWLSNNDSSKIAELVPDTHIFLSCPQGGARWRSWSMFV